MIIQTGMRTDIPAFYSEWFLNRVKEGYVFVRNPYDQSSVTRYDLSPKVVDLIAFCTKKPAPMLGHTELLKPYGQYWFVTITPYGKEIEPNVPDKKEVMESFKMLSETVGINSVGWRYDPIFVSKRYSIDYHMDAFEKMAANLCGYTDVCVISFIDLYKKVERNFPEARNVLPNERAELGKAFVAIGKKYGMTIKPCAEGEELSAYGADCRGCMTLETFEKAVGSRLNAPKRRSARLECACYLGNDIGQYDTCCHLCRYCYANANASAVRANMMRHDPKSPFLIGNSLPGDTVHIAKQQSWIDDRISFL